MESKKFPGRGYRTPTPVPLVAFYDIHEIQSRVFKFPLSDNMIMMITVIVLLIKIIIIMAILMKIILLSGIVG